MIHHQAGRRLDPRSLCVVKSETARSGDRDRRIDPRLPLASHPNCLPSISGKHNSTDLLVLLFGAAGYIGLCQHSHAPNRCAGSWQVYGEAVGPVRRHVWSKQAEPHGQSPRRRRFAWASITRTLASIRADLTKDLFLIHQGVLPCFERTVGLSHLVVCLVGPF